MAARCSLVVNGKAVRISTGDTPLEAALAEGVIAPMQAVHGTALLGQAASPSARRARARTRSDSVKLSAIPGPSIDRAAESRPADTAALRRTGQVSEVSALGPHLTQVVVTLTKRLAFEPGHQVSVIPEGLPPVSLAPSLRLDGGAELNELVFHLPAEHAFAEGVAVGHAIKVKGPMGRGFYRPGGGRLVLVAGETGFAGIWAIARAARYVEPARELHLLIGARDPLDLYMRPALDWLRATGVARIVMVADRTRQRPPDVRPGPLTAHVPQLRSTDVVHVSGCASTVGAVEVLAAHTGARCYTIPLPPRD